MSANCELCKPDMLLIQDERAYIRFDNNNLSEGHVLVIPRRHVASYFDMTSAEKSSVLALLDQAKVQIDKQFSPDGYNIGVNIGPAGGQSRMHVHVHLIPRYEGDVPDPRDGVEWQNKLTRVSAIGATPITIALFWSHTSPVTDVVGNNICRRDMSFPINGWMLDARSDVAMRTLYVGVDETVDLPGEVCVLQVTPLLGNVEGLTIDVVVPRATTMSNVRLDSKASRGIVAGA